MDSTVRYMYHSYQTFMEVADGIYKIIKNKEETVDKFKYVGLSEVVDALNNFEKILIVDKNKRNVHANFEL